MLAVKVSKALRGTGKEERGKGKRNKTEYGTIYKAKEAF